jgi:hypothetical protein
MSYVSIRGIVCKFEVFLAKFPYFEKMKIGYFSAKVGREDIFKPKIRNESLHEIMP